MDQRQTMNQRSMHQCKHEFKDQKPRNFKVPWAYNQWTKNDQAICIYMDA